MPRNTSNAKDYHLTIQDLLSLLGLSLAGSPYISNAFTRVPRSKKIPSQCQLYGVAH